MARAAGRSTGRFRRLLDGSLDNVTAGRREQEIQGIHGNSRTE